MFYVAKKPAFIISMKDPDKFDVGLGYIKSILKATNTEQPHHLDGKASETPSSRNVSTLKCANRFLWRKTESLKKSLIRICDTKPFCVLHSYGRH